MTACSEQAREDLPDIKEKPRRDGSEGIPPHLRGSFLPEESVKTPFGRRGRVIARS